MAHLSTKTYGAERGLSCAFRQWAADSHCQLLHGYSLGFRFTFAAEQLDHRGWVVDYGKGGFGPIREWLHATFDHTLLISEDDPDRDVFLQLETLGLAQTRLVPGTSCERLSQYVLEHAEALIRKATSGRCWVQSVECFEHGANSAIYENPSALLSKIDLEVYTRLAADVSANDRHLDQAGDSTRVK
jgi:6-pyruvoyltetrahydropterin/6-carboxytetrahydropterin synthase|tara:strand:- start:126 stop:686 length:561 start_codon:yes stop_codon:yes gene_type:complete